MKKAALITGGARRIGKHIVEKLARMGYNIALHYNSSFDSAIKIQFNIKKLGVDCELFQCDLSKENEILSLIASVKNKFNRLNLLINNASIFNKAKLFETEMDLFNKTFSINFKAPYILSRDFARLVDNGNIINIIDTKITKNNFMYSAYSLSKKCLADFTLMSAKELAPKIRVNGICPGLILGPKQKSKEYLMDDIIKNIPLKRKGELSDITEALSFLINNNYITGQIIYIDGGQHL